MRIALVTLLNDSFMIAYKVFMKSLLTTNKWFDLDFIILDDKISEKNKSMCRTFYKNIEFRKINYERYSKKNWHMTHPKLKSTYYKLDIFAFRDYNRIVFIDLDTVVLKNIKDLFYSFPQDICGAKAYSLGSDNLRRDINSGVIILNKPVMNEAIYTDLINLSAKGFNLPDQKVINHYFKGKIAYIPKTFNCEKRIIYSKKFNYSVKRNSIAILHYVGNKPWQSYPEAQDYTEIEKIWHQYNVMPWQF